MLYFIFGAFAGGLATLFTLALFAAVQDGRMPRESRELFEANLPRPTSDWRRVAYDQFADHTGVTSADLRAHVGEPIGGDARGKAGALPCERPGCGLPLATHPRWLVRVKVDV